MKFSTLLFCVFLNSFLFSQQDSLFTISEDSNRKFELGGLGAYYIWEEDSLGKIIDSTFQKFYKSNTCIRLKQDSVDLNYRLSSVKNALIYFANENNGYRARSKFKVQHEGKLEKVRIPFYKDTLSNPFCVAYKKNSNKLTSQCLGNVLYFNVLSDSSRFFSHANDSIVLQKMNIQTKAFGHYIVKSFWNSVGVVVDQQVYAFNGENVTSYFQNQQKPLAKHIVVFSNGYRGPKKNRDQSDNLITKKDRYRYWLRLDKAFLKRIKPDDYFYIDGSHSISTSNHRTMANFTLSYTRIKALHKKEKNRNDYYLLNTIPNDSGFYQRKEKGKIAAKAFIVTKCNSPACIEVKDTLDIVAHSMGYAYALGFVEGVKDYVVFRNFYIIAPENACAGGTDWGLFHEVWQYGSNLNTTNPDPVWLQDGIAPQCAVKGITEIKNGGRVFFPPSSKRLNFINSHMLNHYRWIFTDLHKGESGYVD